MSVIIFYDPLLFLKHCCTCTISANSNQRNGKSEDKKANGNKHKTGKKNAKHFYQIVKLIRCKLFNCTWEAHRACVFGLSSLLTVDPSQLPDEYVTVKYCKQLASFLEMITSLIFSINYVDLDDDDDGDDEKSNSEHSTIASEYDSSSENGLLSLDVS